jgi:hypothetical protein
MSVASGNYEMAMFALRPALPRALWARFGGLALGDLDFAPVDRALELLRRPTTVEDRLCILQQLVEFWHGPIKLKDGMSDAELAGAPLPRPLRWWYRRAGKRTEIMSGRNILYRPVDKRWQLTVEGRHLPLLLREPGLSLPVHADTRRRSTRLWAIQQLGPLGTRGRHAVRTPDPGLPVRGRDLLREVRGIGAAGRGEVF